jgi:hypothetical protein
MMTIRIAALAAVSLLLHPGHSTRVEVQFNADSGTIELAMRIDHADLEAALGKRLGRGIAIETLTDDQAAEWIAPYLRETLRIEGQKIAESRFHWVGWERKRISSWVYAELTPEDTDATTVPLSILTLYETEPELNHVVTIRGVKSTDSVVLSKREPIVNIPTRPIP